jgi:leader peptidase (prepilin peptidase)/N-methyltransferase
MLGWTSATVVLVCAGAASLQPWLLRRLARLWRRDLQAKRLGLPMAALRKTWPTAIVMMLAAIVGVWCVVVPSTAPGPRWLAMAGLSLLAFVIGVLDWRCLWAPDALTVPLGLLGLFVGHAEGHGLAEALFGAGLGYCIFALLRLGWRRWRGHDGIGGGDVHLAAAMGAWLGPYDFPVAVLVASLVALAAATVLPGGQAAGRTQVPFGPFLALGLLMVWSAKA